MAVTAAYSIVNKDDMTAIADRIRAAHGTTAGVKIGEMPGLISSISGSGFESDGYIIFNDVKLAWPKGKIFTSECVFDRDSESPSYDLTPYITEINIPSYDTTSSDDFFRSGIKTLSAPCVKSIASETFSSCHDLVSASFVNAESIGDLAFGGCVSLESLLLPSLVSITGSPFESTQKLLSLDLPLVTSIPSEAESGYSAFGATYLQSIDLRSMQYTTVADNNGWGAQSGCMITCSGGEVYTVT